MLTDFAPWSGVDPEIETTSYALKCRERGNWDGISKEVHERVQAGCGATIAGGGARGFGGAQSGSEPAGVGPLEPRCGEVWERAFPGVGQKRVEETRIAELERKIGQQVLEIDFLKRALQHVEQQRQLRAASGGASFTNRSSAK